MQSRFHSFSRCPALWLLAFIILSLPQLARAEFVEVSNLRAAQQPGSGIVDIYYDVSAITDSVQVGISVVDLADPDAEPIAVTSATGHIGVDVPVGGDRHVQWDAATDWGDWNFTRQMKFAISAQPQGGVVSPSGDLDFGDVVSGQTASRELTLYNPGNAELSVSGITYPTGFSGDWSGGTIAAGGRQLVTVSFTPTEAQSYSGNIEVNSDATEGAATLEAAGVGIGSQIILSGETNFGGVLLNQNVTSTLTLSNAGNRSLLVSGITYPAGFSGDWSSGTIAAGSSQLVTLTFTPTQAQLYSGDVEVNSDATIGSGRLPVTGMGRLPLVFVEGGTLAMSMGTVSVDTFYIGSHEVTWGEWKAVRTWAAANGYDIGSRGAGCEDDHPVHTVNWYDVVKWCNLKSELEGLTPVYSYNGSTFKQTQPSHTSISQNLSANGYRLPQEAEWEFAARGGNQTNGTTYAGSNNLNVVGWYSDNSGGAACNLSFGRGTWPVGQKAANELGLYDMSGNVWEWCWDQNGSFRRIRGGSWSNGALGCAVSYRYYYDGPDLRYFNIGFRIARSSGN